jgi:rhodanese-related sulfurtransferase
MEQFIEFAAENWYLFVALIFILGWLIGSEVLRKFRGVTSVTPVQVLQLINHEDAVVLDTRDISEYKLSHIPGARHIPANTFQNRLQELQKFKDKPVIVYGRVGTSSTNTCALLKKQGFTAVYSLNGGLPAWQNANLPTSKK